MLGPLRDITRDKRVNSGAESEWQELMGFIETEAKLQNVHMP